MPLKGSKKGTNLTTLRISILCTLHQSLGCENGVGRDCLDVYKAYVQGKREMCSKIMPGNPKRTEYLDCEYVVLRIILKWKFDECLTVHRR